LLYSFEDFVFDTDQRELRRGSRLIPLQPQVFDVLHYLIANRLHVVSKDELIEAVWGKRIVSESALATRINAARTAIGDSGEAQRLIRTLPRKGFRFIGAAVEQERAVEPVLVETRVSSAARAPVAPEQQILAERRPLTALSCELIFASTGAEHLDAEEFSEIIVTFHRRMAELIALFNGHVGQSFGNTVLCHFGYPTAHENDAEQAVRAALQACEVIPGMDLAPGGTRPQARIGIATSQVIVHGAAGGAGREDMLLGKANGWATQLQSATPPGTVLIDLATRRLIGNLFDCEEIEPIPMVGSSESLRAWRVLRASSVVSRFRALRPGTVTPLVGREDELELLLRRWTQAKSGRGRVVVISGEAGIGKSRLIAAFQEALQLEPHFELGYFCSPHHRESAWLPIINELERAADFSRSDSPQQKFAKLERLLSGIEADREHLTLLSDLLALQTGDPRGAPPLSPQKHREKMIAVLLERLMVLAARQSTLVVFEDVHWIDPTSLDFLALAIERAAQLRVLLLVTARPEFKPSWPEHAHITILTLPRLSQSASVRIVEKLAGENTLSEEVVAAIVARTDGNPLFAEELTKAVVEAGGVMAQGRAWPAAAAGVPASLNALLTARLDRLGPAVKDVAQCGAAIGREFSHELLMRIASEASAVQDALDRLADAELVFVRGQPPNASYIFKHALVRDAAYASLIRGKRQQLHRQIATALCDHFSALADAEPEIVAHHFTEAGLPEPAIGWWTKAGEQGLRRSALTEAISHFGKAIELADGSASNHPGPADRLRLQIAYGQALMAAKGWGASETSAAFARAREFVGGVESAGERFSLYYGLWVGSYVRGELAPMRELSEAFLREVAERPELPESATAHRVFGLTCWFQGDFEQARPHLERAVTLSNVDRDRPLAFHFGQEPGTTARLSLALALAPVGELARVRGLLDQAGIQARQSGHIPTIAYMHGLTCIVEAVCHDAGRAEPHARALRDVSSEYGLQLWAAAAAFFGAWTRWRSGQRGSEIDEMRDCMARLYSSFQPPIVPLGTVLLAEAEEDAGHVDLALNMMDELLVENERSGQHWFDAEVHRRRGELLGRNNASAAETAFNQALAIARRQKAKLLELRAAMSLARLWRDQGKHAEAHQLVAPIYGWFTEGFDTRDLKEAKALLDKIAAED